MEESRHAEVFGEVGDAAEDRLLPCALPHGPEHPPPATQDGGGFSCALTSDGKSCRIRGDGRVHGSPLVDAKSLPRSHRLFTRKVKGRIPLSVRIRALVRRSPLAIALFRAE